MTRQRLAIFQTFLECEGHPTAEELYTAVRIQDASVGQTTVYRTLKLLCKAGLAKRMHFTDKTAKFELQEEAKEHHDHLICEACGSTTEFFEAGIENLQRTVAEKNGFIPTGHRLYLYGLCPDCRKKEFARAKGRVVNV